MYTIELRKSLIACLASEGMSRPQAFIRCLVVVIVLWTCSVHANDWPRFLGPMQDNTSAEADVWLDWPESGPPERWRVKVGNAYSAPSVAQGKLVVFHRRGNEEIVACLDPMTGQSLWESAYPTRYEDRYGYNNGPRAAPLIDKERVFTMGAEGVLSCFELLTGKEVWQRHVYRDYAIDQGFFGAGTPPIPYENLVLINAGSAQGGIMAFDMTTGKTVWKATAYEASYSAGVIQVIQGKPTALFLTRDAFVGLSPDTGVVLFEYPFRSRLHESVNAASPVVHQDEVFLSATYGVGAALLRVHPDRIEEIWRDNRAMENHWSTSIRVGDYVYGVHGRHESGSAFRCMAWADGSVRWDAPRGLGRASFIRAGDRFIAIGERGDLAVIRISPEAYQEERRIKVLDYPCWTPPVLSHGLLYLRNENTLLCLDLRVPSSLTPTRSP